MLKTQNENCERNIIAYLKIQSNGTSVTQGWVGSNCVIGTHRVPALILESKIMTFHD